LRAAFAAKFGLGGIIDLTFGAFHAIPPLGFLSNKLSTCEKNCKTAMSFILENIVDMDGKII
jgi:hypothetical protein